MCKKDGNLKTKEHQVGTKIPIFTLNDQTMGKSHYYYNSYGVPSGRCFGAGLSIDLLLDPILENNLSNSDLKKGQPLFAFEKRGQTLVFEKGVSTF